MTPSARHVLLGAPFDPYRLTNNAAAYSLSGAASDSTYLTGASGLYYVADRSGNSAVNGLVLPGVAGNTATTASKGLTGNQTITADVQLTTYTPGTLHELFTKQSGNDGLYFRLQVDGTLRLTVGDGTSLTNMFSPVTGLAAFTRATLSVVWTDGVGATFFVNGAQLGTPQAAAKTLTNAATTATIGTNLSGIVYRVQVGSSYDFNATTAAKLATSVTDGVSGTWTINQTAIALPARIHGARDLYQHLTASMPTFSVSGGYNIATFDGTADYVKSAPYSLSQPESVYFVGSQVSWTSGDYLYDGSGNAVMVLQQQTGTPQLNIYAGTYVGTTSPAIGSRFVDTAVFNGASSSHRLNKDAAVTGSCGVQNGSGFTLGSPGSGTSNWGNFTWSEALLRSAADAEALQLRIAAFEMRKWGIS